MTVLGLETVTSAGSVALCDGERCVAREGDPAAGTHGERLPGEVLSWLSNHGRTLAEIELFAIVSGPGSFTGLRVGMAAVQGFALASGRRVVAVPTLDAMADAWIAAQGGDVPDTLLATCLDGHRGEIFLAAYRMTANRNPVPALGPSVGPPEHAAARLADVWQGERVVFAGNGAVKYGEQLRRPWPAAACEALTVPLAEAAARQAARDPDRGVVPHALRPVYVRRPDAELARDRASLTAVAPAPDLDGLRFSRATSRDDLSAVEALQRKTFTNPWSIEAIRWELQNTDVARLYLARTADGGVVGYCACWAVFDELHINSLAVDDDWRRRGIARRLLQFVIREAVEAGARSATLEVRRSNQAALALYERLGFHVEGVRRDYYQAPREDALILWNRRLV
jgi:ribosomal-protein-alanine N-acetyltransferase